MRRVTTASGSSSSNWRCEAICRWSSTGRLRSGGRTSGSDEDDVMDWVFIFVGVIECISGGDKAIAHLPHENEDEDEDDLMLKLRYL
jgi:hypothetical protein